MGTFIFCLLIIGFLFLVLGQTNSSSPKAKTSRRRNPYSSSSDGGIYSANSYDAGGSDAGSYADGGSCSSYDAGGGGSWGGDCGGGDCGGGSCD